MPTPARRGSYWRMGGGAFFVAAALSGGCSVLFHADATQCSTSVDCTSRGTAFAGYQCVQSTCIRPQCQTTSDCVALDAALSSYECDRFTCVKPTPIAEGGTDAIEAGVAGCDANSDCPVTDQMHREVACNVDTHQCLQLTSNECPYVIGDLTTTDSKSSTFKAPGTFLGAFAVFPQGATTHPTFLNYQLALAEITNTSGGLPIGTNVTADNHRVPIAVACDVETPNLDTAMMHLINDVRVPVIVSALAPAALLTAFDRYSLPGNVLTINALAYDPTFISVTTQGYLWHMLGSPTDVAPAYAAFVPLVERYLRSSSGPKPIGSTRPMKVVTITSNSTATNALASAVENVLTWNGGQTVAQNSPDNYLPLALPDSTLNGTSPTDPTLLTAEQSVAMQVQAFHPDLIISFASLEFDQLSQYIEFYKDPTDLPFYLVGPYNAGDNGLLTTVQNNISLGTVRIAGVAFASVAAAYLNILQSYRSRFDIAYPNALAGSDQEENYYDAMYFALYSMLYAGQLPTGMNAVAGMKHLIDVNAPNKFSVGPGDQGSIYGALALKTSLQLNGTLGAPTFDPVTGARLGAGDVYCFQHAPSGNTYVFANDVLRLVNSDGSSPGDGGSPFTGSFPCFSGIQ